MSLTRILTDPRRSEATRGAIAAAAERLFRTLPKSIAELAVHQRKMRDMLAAAMDQHGSTIKEHICGIDTALRHTVMYGQADGSFVRLDPDATGVLLHVTMIGFCHPAVVRHCLDDDLPAMAEFCLRALRSG